MKNKKKVWVKGIVLEFIFVVGVPFGHDCGCLWKVFFFQSGSVAIITASSYGKRYETDSPEQWKEGQRVTSFRLYDGDEKPRTNYPLIFFTTRKFTCPPFKNPFQKEQIVFQASFLKGELLVFSRIPWHPQNLKPTWEVHGFNWLD